MALSKKSKNWWVRGLLWFSYCHPICFLCGCLWFSYFFTPAVRCASRVLVWRPWAPRLKIRSTSEGQPALSLEWEVGAYPSDNCWPLVNPKCIENNMGDALQGGGHCIRVHKKAEQTGASPVGDDSGKWKQGGLRRNGYGFVAFGLAMPWPLKKNHSQNLTL